MSKPEWGTKRICQSCAAQFYDMRKSPIICPKCKATYNPEAVARKHRRPPEKPAPVKPAAAEDDIPLPEVEAEVAIGEEEAVIEDTSELGEDDEDISEAIEKGEDEG